MSESYEEEQDEQFCRYLAQAEGKDYDQMDDEEKIAWLEGLIGLAPLVDEEG